MCDLQQKDMIRMDVYGLLVAAVLKPRGDEEVDRLLEKKERALADSPVSTEAPNEDNEDEDEDLSVDPAEARRQREQAVVEQNMKTAYKHVDAVLRDINQTAINLYPHCLDPL